VSWVRELSHGLEGRVFDDEATRAGFATDFGRIVRRTPAAIVRPGSAEDVARTLQFAAGHGLRVATRGMGHSQGGQSLSDHIVLDMAALDDILDVDEKGLTVTCQAGVTWRSLLKRLASFGLSPPVLTNNLDVTVGGTLSTGGLGVASWRYGTQADQCLALAVVTGEGEIVHCSESSNREVFDAVRAGCGQFGVITEAKLRVRRHRPAVRTYFLLYDDLAALLDDFQLLIREERFDYLESWCAPCPQGFKRVGDGRQAFAQWFYPLHATIETDWRQPSEEGVKLQGLRFYKYVHSEEGSTMEFFTRLDALFALWKRGGFWDWAHPWMECILPWEAAPFYVTQVLGNLPPQVVAGGHILLWPARGHASSVPLFMRPRGEYVVGFGILPAVSPRFLDEALPRLHQASAASMMMGGKRYLSGWVSFDPIQWNTHYADLWPTILALKRKYDPKGVFNTGFLQAQ
jgi:cytokinin dehydrogenase